ncbi:hypothetical protein V8F06_014370 [Rhypophila decipiens]
MPAFVFLAIQSHLKLIHCSKTKLAISLSVELMQSDPGQTRLPTSTTSFRLHPNLCTMEPPNLADNIGSYFLHKLRIIDHTLDDVELESRCPLDNGRHAFTPKTSVGQLDLLPIELIDQVLILLDIPTLTNFRRVNQRAMHLVDSLPPYRRLWTSCPNVLRAVISIKASSFSCQTLFKTLTQEKCESCDCFGGYLYLISCKRVCYLCFTSKKEYFPVKRTFAKKHIRSTQKTAVNHLPQIQSLPGRYTASAKLSKHRINLVDRQAVLDLNENSGVFNKIVVDYKSNEPQRFMSIIRAPRLSFPGMEVEWGSYCVLCRDRTEPSSHFRIQYSSQDILEHLSRHPEIQPR